MKQLLPGSPRTSSRHKAAWTWLILRDGALAGRASSLESCKCLLAEGLVGEVGAGQGGQGRSRRGRRREPRLQRGRSSEEVEGEGAATVLRSGVGAHACQAQEVEKQAAEPSPPLWPLSKGEDHS